MARKKQYPNIRKPKPDESKKKDRKCLMCERLYESISPGDRICKDCKQTQAYRSA